jgi:hypothetical protein
MAAGETHNAVPERGIIGLLGIKWLMFSFDVLACNDIEGAGVEVSATAPASLADKTAGTVDDCNLLGEQDAV